MNNASLLTKTDSRMRFNNAQDPIYFLFDAVEQRSISDLTKDFVKDTIYDFTKFISKVVK